jgi:hypothetical protein
MFDLLGSRHITGHENGPALTKVRGRSINPSHETRAVDQDEMILGAYG